MNHKDTITAFMQAWLNEDYEQMYQFSQKTWKANNTEGVIKALFQDAKLKKYNIFSSTFVSNAAMKYNVDITLQSDDHLMSVVMVLCEDEAYKPRAYGEWGVNPLSVQNIISKIAPKKKVADKDAPAPKKSAKNDHKSS